MSNIYSLECLCVKTGSGSISGAGISVKAKLNASPASLKAKINAAGSISAPIVRARTSTVELNLVSSIASKLSVSGAMVSSNLIAEYTGDFNLTADYAATKHIINDGDFISVFTDKFAGSFGEFECVQKLYPSSDIALPEQSGVGVFVGPLNETSDLYEFINDGVFVGDYHKNLSISYLLSDDNATYIQPSSVNTLGSFAYKCSVNKPLATPKNSTFRIRASAPLKNYETETPPQYTITDIKFEDPSGNLIVEYEDIVVRGDANHYDENIPNYATYSAVPKVNKAALYAWESGYPILDSSDDYTLSFRIDVLPADDAFTDGFDRGFLNYFPNSYSSNSNGNNYLSLDGAPIGTHGTAINPIKGIRISAIEICNSGATGSAPENYLPVYMEVVPTGFRVERTIYPIAVPLYGYDTAVYPTVSSVWNVNGDTSLTNETIDGAGKILSTLRQTRLYSDYINLDSAVGSGKLVLKFGHEPVGLMNHIDRGEFNCAFDQSLCGMWVEPSGAFNTLNKTPFLSSDHFFKVDTISLKVLAKKEAGANDYSLDVVGFSDDRLLNVTSAVGGFLQNVNGVGTIPSISGFSNVDDLGVGGEAISDRDQYFETNLTNNAGGDHYILSNYPVVNTTDFAWYEIPLKIYDDTVELGKSRDHSMSSLFEHLYLDIYPLPSGASIAAMHILVRYAPQSAFNLITEGGEDIRKIQLGRSEGEIYPTSRQDNDDILNAGPEYNPLSYIDSIPHAYATPSSIKSNYSRRWRGYEGLVQGAFDPNGFNFGFSNPHLDFPFNFGFFDFANDEGHTLISRDASASGTLHYSGPVADLKYKNVGWRFKESTAFDTKLPGYSGAYETIDWTSLSSGASNFQGDVLYGKIADAFSNAVRICCHDAYIDFGHDFDISNGFTAYIRFSPDSDASGVGYNFLNSGTLFSKWGKHNPPATQDLEFALGYENGYLCGVARDIGGNIVKVVDTVPFSGYQYPLSVILTYNDNNSSGLKLYTDNELQYPWTTLRASSVAPFEIYSNDSDLIVGYSTGSGVGMRMFVTEFGFSTSGNIVYENANLRDKQTTADKFLENHRVKWWNPGEPASQDSYKLWSYIDENTLDDWNIGDFKYCAFDTSFDILSKRTGRDLIGFDFYDEGLPYSQKTDLSLPATINSDVAYHTQIENDFLRIHLSDTPSNFFSTLRRISKDLPRGYKFADRALVVETVIDHESSGNINWTDGKVGPKLIVSLYTKRKEPYWIPDEPNWGLINRSIHYIEPSSCLMRVDSTFTYDSFVDDSEAWALFPQEPKVSEFKEKYFSEDIDDMFLQYDLVYPSGSAFHSRLNIHSAHVRLEDAYVRATDGSGVFNLVSSGGYPVNEYINLFHEGRYESANDSLYLYTIGPIKIENSGLPIYTSGIFASNEILNLSLFSKGDENSSLNVSISGSPSKTLYDADDSLSLHLFGKGIVTSRAGDNLGISLTAYNDNIAYIPDPNVLNLFSYGSNNTTVYASMPIFMYNGISFGTNGETNQTLNLRTLGSEALFSRYPNGSLNLFTFSNKPEEKMNLTLYADPVSYAGTPLDNDLSLFVGTRSFLWYNNDYGKDITILDNSYASLPVGDEIRGVDLIGYGSCTGNSPRKAIDPAVITHDTVWRPETCNDGGIFRAIETYTNLDAGYSGNYYGIRKYTLPPNTLYNATLKITTGSTDPIPVPREWEEWEYGINDDVTFSGVKLIGDSPNSIEPSGRNAQDKYGKSVAVKKDLIAIGAPFQPIPDEEDNLIQNAGAVFLYRKGEDVAGEQASWSFEQKLLLPEGYRRDYISKTIDKLMCYPTNTDPEFCVSGQKWNIGQEGREFGHSLDVASSGSRETIVVGAPGAAWTRTFDEIQTSGIPVAMLVVTDKFDLQDLDKINRVKNTARKWDILYKYFSAPWQEGFQPQLDIKLIVCQLWKTSQGVPSNTWKSDNKYTFGDNLYHTYISRLDDQILIDQYGTGYIYNSMLSGINAVFDYAFPHGNSVHSGVPPIFGVFSDNSLSTVAGSVFKPVVDEFISYYQEYSYASGVIDPSIPQAESGYYNSISGSSEEWYTASERLMNETLDSGNLILNDALKFITSGVGQEWAQSSAYEFQIPPASGGRVYIFEKENGIFNLVQEIKSPDEATAEQSEIDSGLEFSDTYRYTVNDRFGHSVSISENSEVLAVGSPYSSKACQIFERDDTETVRLLSNLRSWLVYQGKTTEVNRYDFLVNASGLQRAKEIVYDELSQGDKFLVRSDENFWATNGGTIKLYKNIFSYSHLDIPYTGTWGFISNEFAGTSRLGFSSAVDDDGSIVAFGAPTDSFNEFDDTNMWYANEDTWASYTNAGAVRIFESRKYHPHNLVVEYSRFGNLDRSAHPEYAEYYDQMGLYFNPDQIPFRRMAFSELDIPKEAGLAFIITPELDAASDEIIENLKNWLSLGDRTLVLVGNDPIWEDNGLYKSSNDIINKILEKLNSRMRLVPARNRYESLPNCVSVEDYNNDKYNVTKSIVPNYAHSTYINPQNLFAKGVADIKIDLTRDNLQYLEINSPCDAFTADEQKINPYCELPIKHLGDLRAEWNMECEKTVGNKKVKIKYKENWPFHFDNPNPAQQCDNYPESPKPEINRRYQDPRPILTAAEWIPAYSYIIPANSGYYFDVERTCTTYNENTEILVFAENQNGEIAFNIQDTPGNIEDASGIFAQYSEGTFFNPVEFDDRDSLIQATGEAYALNAVPKSRVVSNDSSLIVEETFVYNEESTTSSVVLIASLVPESDRNLGYNDNLENNNNDQNIAFYSNLVMKDCDTEGTIYQLGGWTGRTSFVDAFSDSKLTEMFDSYGHNYRLNINEDDLNDTSDSLDPNVLWIANPTGRPTLAQIIKIRNWLREGNKKVVITYSTNQEIASNVDYICDQLDIVSRPFYSESENQYLDQTTSIFDETPPQNPPNDPLQVVNTSHPAIIGCATGYGFNSFNQSTAVSKLSVVPKDFPEIGSIDDVEFIPIKPASSAQKIVSYDKRLEETYWETPFAWKINANASVDFNVLPGSGYRMFINWVSETPEEKFDIAAKLNGIILDPNENEPGQRFVYLDKTTTYNQKTEVIDFKVPDGTTNISLTFDTDRWFKITPEEAGEGVIPSTPRVLSVSGCLLPIDTITLSTPKTICKDKLIRVDWYEPEREIIVPEEFRPIKTDSGKYCADTTGCPGKLIEDGPIIAAEEFENFSSFTDGYERSRIVVISDSTLLQGQCPHYRNDALAENQKFIRGLYPPSPESSVGDLTGAVSNTGTARVFNFVQKVIAPERGSPAKYFASGQYPLLVDKFGLNGVAGNYNRYTSSENDYDPATLSRPANPVTEEERKQEVENFEQNVIPLYGVFPRFSGIIGGDSVLDAGVGGGIPELLKRTGKDYIDFDVYPSGFNGDLFGYSVDIHNGKLIVGSPFNGFDGEEIYDWDSTVESGLLKINPNGGAGAAFFFERTGQGSNFVSNNLPWEFKQKLKPESVNISSNSGSGIISDEFGYSVSIDADFVAVGAPGHDFDTLHEHIYDSGEFIRKDFNVEFDIPEHRFYDLGSSGVRIDQFGGLSGVETLNNGAVFTFNHEMIDWQSRTKRLNFAEKLTEHNYFARSGINDYFGRSICIDRTRRGDSDYTLVVGASNHDYATSGNHITGDLENAGAAYVYDAMLREQIASTPSSGGWIEASLIGDGSLIQLYVEQNTTGAPISYYASGIIASNKNGDVFLEASGYDSASKGFVIHRPYVENVVFRSLDGTQTLNVLNLNTIGEPLSFDNNLDLSILGSPSAFVYNNINLNTLGGWNLIGESGLNLITSGSNPATSEDYLNLYSSGIDLLTSQLNLRIRGK